MGQENPDDDRNISPQKFVRVYVSVPALASPRTTSSSPSRESQSGGVDLSGGLVIG